MITSTGHLGSKTVKRIGFGAMQLAGKGVFGPPKDRDAAIAVLRRAIELGVDHIDTAQFYGPDVVNDLIREALHPYGDNLRLVTKVGAERSDTGEWLPAQEPADLRRGVEANLTALGVERMDLVNLRLHGHDPEHVDTSRLDEQLAELVAMQGEGKLDLIGISTADRATVERALEITPLGEVQNPYSILDRSDQPVLDLCNEQGIAYVPYFPLGSAFTGGPAKIAADPTIARIADAHGVAPTQVALAWLLEQGNNVLLIPGTSSVAHLEQNLAVADIELTADDLAALDAVQVGAAVAAEA